MASEDKFTRPRADCPHPEWWHALTGQATETEVSLLIKSMVYALQPSLVVETGTDTGETAEMIGNALARNGHGRLITIEANAQKARAARQRLADRPVIVLHGDSCDRRVQTMYGGGPVDLLWIDGRPTTTRIQEWEAWKPYLRYPGGVAAFHDTGPHRPFRAHLDADPDLNILHFPTPRGVSIGMLR